MRIFVTTCDEYIYLVEGFVYMFNKYWSPEAEVVVLGYKSPEFRLPDNFKFVSLGNQKDYGTSWTTALIPFFKWLPDEYFGLLLDDYYIPFTDQYVIAEAEKHMANGVSKISFVSLKRYPGASAKEKDANFDIINQTYKHRLALWPQLIRRDYFLKYLKKNQSPQQYETQWNVAKKDGAQILASKVETIGWFGIVRRGRFAKKGLLKNIKSEDWEAMRQLGVSSFKPQTVARRKVK